MCNVESFPAWSEDVLWLSDRCLRPIRRGCSLVENQAHDTRAAVPRVVDTVASSALASTTAFVTS